VSRNSDAKKARRKKRRAARDERWIPDTVLDALVQDSENELPPRNVIEAILGVGHLPEDGIPAEDVELVETATKFDEWITARGWTFDSDFSAGGLASWLYGPSAIEFDDEQYEPVTRIWFTVGDAYDDFPEQVNAALVGTGGADGALYAVGPDRVLEHIDAIEAYRPGDVVPVLD